MIDRIVTTVIDQDKCIGCELCVQVCPSQTISMQGDKAIVTGDQSLNCGHCAAVCPVDAVVVKGIGADSLKFNTFAIEDRWLAFGEPDPAELVRLMASRRSCRNFDERVVDRSILEDLVKIGTTAPSGSNCQNWTFTILPNRSAVMQFGDAILAFFKRINKIAEKRLFCRLLKILGKPQLDNYYRDHYSSVQEGIADWEQHGRDRLFHGATAVILVGSKPGGSCPQEDALLATQNIILAAHTMELGTCLIGYAVEAIRNGPVIKKSLKIPDEEAVYAVIALGYPAEKYQKLTGRKKVISRFVD